MSKDYSDRPESHFIRHGPCSSCGSSDANAIYSDNHQVCFACDAYVHGDSSYTSHTSKPKTRPLEMTGTITAIQDRRISLDVCKRYGVTTEHDASGNISKHHYPYHSQDGSTVVGTKVRNVATKDFYATGDLGSAGLFGQQSFAAGGKYITITEGELDALAVNEMFDGKWPAVSIRSGASAAVKDIKASLEYLETFDNVVICFDTDEAGTKAAQAVLPLFSPRKAKVCTLTLKDASDMLKANKVREFTRCWWDAKAFKPEGVVSLGDEEVWDKFLKRGTEEVTPLPASFGKLNAMMNGGIAAGEVTVIGALTSIGKTTMVYNLVHGMYAESAKKIGCVFLEADVGETVEKLLSVYMGTNISDIPNKDRDYNLYHEKYDEMANSDKLHILDHQGALESDELFAKMQYLVKGLDCDIIILDPLQAAVTSNDNGVIDAFMDKCLKLAKNTGVSIIIISHMRKPNARDPHDIGEYDLKGSGSINQIAFNTILLSRDKMTDDEYARNCTQVQLVKCRRTGRTGVAGWLFYENNTSRLVATQAPEIKKANSHDDF
jgi:twinkle protein